MQTVYFSETQRPRKLWVRLGTLVTLGWTAFLGYGMVQQVILGEPFGGRPASDAVLIAGWVFGGVLLPGFFLGLLLLTRLRTKVDSEGICVRFHPFHLRWKRWRFEEIRTAEHRSYGPLAEYGGWGIRFGPSGRAYTMSGNEGVQLILHSGDRILIGTKDPAGLLGAFEEAAARMRT